MRCPLLYEINTRCWLAELSARAGRRLTLAEVPDSEFDFWQRCGFTHLWLMGVWTLGRRGRAHSESVFAGREAEFGCSEAVGSPYAIAGYVVSRNLGGESALARFRRKLNARGIKLVLDFVPNHTAIDHPWVKSHPEFYVTSSEKRAGTLKPYRGAAKWFAHGGDGYGDPWVDTLQLDYRNPALRQAMRDELLRIAEKCDGVRCDMAMLVLNKVIERVWREFPADADVPGAEFWTEAIGSVRAQHADFLFLAEVYWDLEARLQELGFDFTYDKRLYDLIVAHNSAGAANYVRSLSRHFLEHSAHFLENHDERRIASLLPREEHRAAALLIMTLPGMRFLHEGQMSGARIHANVHFARRGMEEPEKEIAAFYDTLLGVLPNTAVGQGEWSLLTPQPAWADNPSHASFVLVQWQQHPGSVHLAAINLASHRSQCFAALQMEKLSEGHWRFRDLLGDETFERSGAELAQRGLYLDLPGHGAQLFHGERIQ
jgi:glycosidase